MIIKRYNFNFNYKTIQHLIKAKIKIIYKKINKLIQKKISKIING